MKSYIIGIDGGGTKTLGVLFDIEGKEVARATSGFANMNVDELGSIKSIKEVLEELVNLAHDGLIETVQIGIAGYSNYTKKEQFKEDLSNYTDAMIDIMTDAEIALYSVKRDSDKNVIMILGGTGSVVMVDKDDKIKYIGGFGHLLGDEGSGYHLAITALKGIIEQFESGKEISDLSWKILNEIKALEYDDIKKFVYNNKKSQIAKLSEFIAKEAQKSDQEAKNLFINEGLLLAEQAMKAYKYLGKKQEVLIGFRGGFLLNAPYVKDALLNALSSQNIDYILDDSYLEPVYGSYYRGFKQLKKRWKNG